MFLPLDAMSADCPKTTPLSGQYVDKDYGFEFRYPQGWENFFSRIVGEAKHVLVLGKGPVHENKQSFVRIEVTYSTKYAKTEQTIGKTLERKKKNHEVVKTLTLRGKTIELLERIPKQPKGPSLAGLQSGPEFSFYYPKDGTYYPVSIKTSADGAYRPCDTDALVVSVFETFQ